MIKSIFDLKPKDRQAIGEFCRKLRDRFGDRLHFLRLYGSKFKGVDSEASDIDLFIVVQNCSSEIKDQIIDIAFDINLKHEVYISPRIIPLILFQDSLFCSTPFIKNIEKQSLAL